MLQQKIPLSQKVKMNKLLRGFFEMFDLIAFME